MAGSAEEALLAHLPKGPAWTRALGSLMRSLVAGIAIEFARVATRIEQAWLELDPRYADETIADWERMVGLPTACTPIASTLAERQAEVTKRWIRRGQWVEHVGAQFIEDRIVECGYAASDVRLRRFHFRPFTCGSKCGDQLFGTERGWFFVYQWDVISGDNDAKVVCEIDHYAQAHLGREHAFPLFDWSDGTFSRTGTAVFTHPRTKLNTPLASATPGRTFIGV